YYTKAYALIRKEAMNCAKAGKAYQGYKSVAIEFLVKAHAQIVQFAIPNIEITGVLASVPGDTDLARQILDQVGLLKLYKDHIEKVIGKISNSGGDTYIDIKDVKLLKEFYDKDKAPWQEIMELN